MMKKFKYKKAYCKQMLKFFDIAHTEEKYEITTDKNGEKTKTVERANPLPTFEKFAVSVGVCTQTLTDWCKEHPEFEHAYIQCRELQKDMLNDLAMRGFYNPTYTIFVAKNITDMKDRQEPLSEDFFEIRDAYLAAMKKFGKENL
ncbi:hypothetical protein IKP85_05565 [bacterium]|nr:hypothetical protein [bacterium]